MSYNNNDQALLLQSDRSEVTPFYKTVPVIAIDIIQSSKPAVILTVSC